MLRVIELILVLTFEGLHAVKASIVYKQYLRIQALQHRKHYVSIIKKKLFSLGN